MNPADWMEIPGRLKRAGFVVCFERISYEPDRPLWSAKASRDGRKWSATAKSLSGAFRDLEVQIGEDGGSWREMIAQETQRADCATRAA